MSSSTRPVPATAPPATSGAVRASAAPAPTRRRRSPALIGLGVALVALGGLGGGWLAAQGHDTQPVTVAAAALPAGHTISAADLRTVQVAGDVGFPVTADPSTLVGKVASTTVAPGTVMADTMASGVPGPAGGQSIIGVPLKPGQYPAIGVQSGDGVSLVRGSAAQGEPAQKGAPQAWAGIVTNVSEPTDDGVRTVDVALTAAQAPAAAAATTSGTVVLVLTARGGH